MDEETELRAVLSYYRDRMGVRRAGIAVGDVLMNVRRDSGMQRTIERKLAENCLELTEDFHLRDGELSALVRKIDGPC